MKGQTTRKWWMFGIVGMGVSFLLAQAPAPAEMWRSIKEGDWCGTRQLPEEALEFLRNKPTTLHQRYNPQDTYWIPIALRILCRSDSSGCDPLEETLNSLCVSQTLHFQPAEIQFLLYPEDILWIYDNNAFAGNAWDVISNTSEPQRLNLYIMADYNYCGVSGVCGCFGCCGFGEVTVAAGCNGADVSTLSHEIGHWLYLPHTFSQIDCIECVDRNNCYTCGDKFCDTEADYLDYRWFCPYNGNDQEPSTCPLPIDVITPDETLLMSYAADFCVNRFSQEQQNYMRNVIASSPQRQWIVNVPGPTSPDLASTSVSGETVVVSEAVSPDQVYIYWNSVPGATYYLVAVWDGTTFIRDFITRDTVVFLRGLPAGKLLRAKIFPLNERSFCTQAQVVTFRTATPLRAYATVDSTSCSPGACVTIHVQGGMAPYVYQWKQQGAWTLDSIFSGIPAGWHVFQVLDGNGDSVNIPVYVDPAFVRSPTGVSALEGTTVPSFQVRIQQDVLTLSWTSLPMREELQVSIVDMQGRTLVQSTCPATASSGQCVILLPEGSAGYRMYPLLVRIQQGSQEERVFPLY